MKRQFLLAASGIALCATPAFAQVATPGGPEPTPPPPAATAPAPTETGVADIIVTANRREERQQAVPIAITAFTPQRLEQQGITQPQDLNSLVPSLIVGSNGQGSRDSQTFTLRGQGATFQASPGVVVYLNEVPLPAPITLSQQGGPGNYVDLENLQVLAGPQGTLFGRNTTGGAILLVPHKPTNDFSGSIKAQYGSRNDNEFEGVLNLPVIDDKLLVRVVGAYHDRDGYTKDLTFDRDLDNTHWYSGRIGVTFRPSDAFDNYLMAYGSRSKFHGTGLKLEAFNIDGFKGVGFCTDGVPPGPSGFAVPCDVYRNAVSQAKADGPRATRPGIRQSQDTKTWGVSDTARLALTDELSLRNIISYQRFKSNYYYDQDGTPLQQYDASLPSDPRPRDFLEEFTEELQLQGNLLDNHLVFTAGGFLYDQKPAGAQGVSAIVYCPAAVTLGGFSCPASNASVAVRNQSKALYAQATLDLGAFAPSLDGLKLTGGYRYTWDKITGNAYSFSPTTGGFTCNKNNNFVATNPTVNCAFGAVLHSKAPNWTIGLDYKLRQVLLFGKVSRGYKAGGFNSYSVRDGTETFDPEFVTSYEVGFKSDFRVADVPARLNASFYYLNYKNIQKATGDFNTQTQASGAAIYNAAAHIKGVEVEATIRPWKPLELGGSFSYTDFKYTKYLTPAGGVLFDCSGTIPAFGTSYDSSCIKGQYIAPYIFNLHAALNLPVGDGLGELAMFVNYSHNAAQHTEALVVPPQQLGERLAPFGLLSASIDLNNIKGTGIDAGLFVTNATNKLYRISNSDGYQIGSLLTASTIYGEPRMYGVRVRYHFGG